MPDDESTSPMGDGAESEAPLIRKARAQVAAARLRGEALVATGRLPSPSGDDAPPPPRKTLPNYKLLRELHRGGQDVVYLAVQESTGRQVAVKILRQGTLGNVAELVRFEREVEMLSRLRHPNVVTIHDCGRADDDVYLVMDYVAGRPLDGYMAHARPPLREALALFARICDGVNAAHLRGVIHRDLKPSNIRVDEDGQPQILDFGLAKLEADAHSSSPAEAMTLTCQFVGSLPWASPEQAAGGPDLHADYQGWSSPSDLSCARISLTVMAAIEKESRQSATCRQSHRHLRRAQVPARQELAWARVANNPRPANLPAKATRCDSVAGNLALPFRWGPFGVDDAA